MRAYGYFMKVFGCLYAMGALVFLFLPRPLFEFINKIHEHLGFLLVLPPASEFFWLPLATSMMVMLSVLSFLAAANPRQRGYPLTILLSKISSTIGFGLMLVIHQTTFAYLLGILTDLPLALVLGYFMLRLVRQQTLGSNDATSKAPDNQ